MRREGDLSGRNARTARMLTIFAMVCDLLALIPIVLVFVHATNNFVVVWLGLLAIVGLLVSVIGMVFAHRCLNPRPSGPFFTLLFSLAIIGGYAFLLYALASLAHMH